MKKKIHIRPLAEATRAAASLYLVEFDDGTVKVGVSDNPQTRLAALANQAKRQYGIAISKWHVFAGAGAFAGPRHECKTARSMERECLNWFSKIATVRSPGREFFTGLDFQAAVSHAAMVIAQNARRAEPRKRTAAEV